MVYIQLIHYCIFCIFPNRCYLITSIGNRFSSAFRSIVYSLSDFRCDSFVETFRTSLHC